MAQLSLKIQDMVTMLTTCLFAGKSDDGLVHMAADVLCQDMKLRITGGRPTGAYFRTVTKLGAEIADGGFSAIAGLDVPEILMPYDQ